MIQSLTVTNHVGDSIVLELTKPEETGFLITDIDGITPDKATINVSDIATSDGGTYVSSRASSRDIDISLRFFWSDDDETIEEIRHKAYKYFPIKKKVTLEFITDDRDAVIEGYVEKNTSSIFTNKEGADITVVCPFPWFKSAKNDGVQTTLFASVERTFEFPFCNDSLEESLLIMSEIAIKQYKTLEYDGEVETGLTFQVHLIGEVSNITIYDAVTGGYIYIDTDKLYNMTGCTLQYGDDIVICTEVGNKSATFTRDGVSYNILNCINIDADWFTLDLGDNTFSFTADEGEENIQMIVTNPILYMGV